MVSFSSQQRATLWHEALSLAGTSLTATTGTGENSGMRTDLDKFWNRRVKSTQLHSEANSPLDRRISDDQTRFYSRLCDCFRCFSRICPESIKTSATVPHWRHLQVKPGNWNRNVFLR